MTTNGRIDFISAYCDRWCERCAFTDRCSSFACGVAIGMCGDFAAGIELAVGAPEPVDGEREPTAGERFLADYVEPSAQELEEIGHREDARDRRVRSHPLARMSKKLGMNAWRWLQSHREALEATPDPIIREAIEIVSWDAFLIGAKVNRALDGRDRHAQGEDIEDDDPIQNDWNGSAKVGLISLERSEAAWRAIEGAGIDGAAVLADAAGHLRRTILDEFPDALLFKRPGFDDLWIQPRL